MVLHRPKLTQSLPQINSTVPQMLVQADPSAEDATVADATVAEATVVAPSGDRT